MIQIFSWGYKNEEVAVCKNMMKNAEQLLNDICYQSSFLISSNDNKNLFIIIGLNVITLEP
jgi:hypothetical protein